MRPVPTLILRVQVMGQQKLSGSGFSAAATLPHTGIVYTCELVQRAPPALRVRVMRQVANK